MSDFLDDLAADMSEFFDEFAKSAVLRPDAGAIPVRVIVSAGIERYVGDRYVKNTFEIRIHSHSGSQRDRLNVQNTAGQIVGVYQLAEPISRDQFSVLWGAEKIQ